MDQDSFRSLLGSSSKSSKARTLGSASRSRGIAVPPSKHKTVDASQPAFKPRKVKNAGDGKYRDRAAERRVGADSDFAHVEAVLHDFEQRNADIEDKEKIEAQRKYLGGDGEHSVLVKGLDFALLEQNKAKSGFTADDADEIEKALLESTSLPVEPAVPKKRTREDLVRELKAKRGKGETPVIAPPEEAKDLERAKQQGKFKPIGFKPIGAQDEKKKKKKVEGDKERKKKKRKVEGEAENAGDVDMMDETQNASTSKAANPSKVEKPSEPVDDEFDIFADVGEYEGLDLEDDDEVEVKPETSQAPPPRRWIDDDEQPAPPPEPMPELSTRASRHLTSRHGSEGQLSEGEMSEDERPMRLVPLASSALHSIKELLEADKAAASYAKNKKKKDKKKKTKGDDDDDDGDDHQEDEKAKQKSLAAKVDRDYKKLKSYTDKKAAGAS